MNTGIFGEGFPYSNFHDLNLDWIIKIAKDFLDQYTHIQEIIENGEESLTNLTEEGLAQLQEKADTLENLLQEWYDTHSEDIATQLADALEDLNDWYTTHETYLDNILATNIAEFNRLAEQKATQTIASIPSDYSTLFYSAIKSSGILVSSSNASDYSDVRNYPVNSVITVLPNALNHVIGKPYDDIGFTVITTGHSIHPELTPYGGEVQIAIPTFDFSNMHQLRTRSYDGEDWTIWTSDVSRYLRAGDLYVVDNSVYTSVHDLPNNSISLVASSASSVLDRPFSGDFYVISTGHSSLTSLYAGKLQIAVPYDNTDHSFRYCSYNGTSWTPWSLDYSTAIVRPMGYITNATTYPDIDLLPLNTIIGFNNNPDILHRPFADNFIIYTTNISGTGVPTIPTGGEIQIAVPFYRSKGEMRYRVYDGEAWDNWSPSKCEITVTPYNWIDQIISHQGKYDELIVHMVWGSYSMFDQTHDETFWKNNRKATRYMGLCLQNTKIIGYSNMLINAQYSGNDEDIQENFSCFCIMDNVELDNLVVVGENIAYIVHDDTPIVNITNSRAVIKNCKFTHNGSPNHSFESSQPICYGSGFSLATYREITNNIFSNPTRTYTIAIHSASDSNGKFIITGNDLVGGTLRLSPMGTGGTGDIVFNNNKIGSAIINLSSPFVVHAWNNPID